MFKAQKVYHCEYDYCIDRDGKEICYCTITM